MNFTVTYRASDGSRQQAAYEASDRVALFAKLKAAGITPIAVSEGVAPPVRTPCAAPSRWKGLVALVIVVIGAAAAYWLVLAPGPDAPQKKFSKPLKAIADEGRVTISPSKPAAPTLKRETAVSSPKVADGVALSPSRPEAAEAASTNATGVATNALPRRKAVLKNGTDQLIAMATSGDPDATIPPLPNFGPEATDQFIATLSKPLEIKPDDSEAVRRVKEHVTAYRQEIARVMRENPGLELNQILNEHREQSNQNAELRGELRSAVTEMLEKGDLAGAVEMRDKMNKALNEMGVPEVDMPLTDEEKAEKGAAENEEAGE